MERVTTAPRAGTPRAALIALLALVALLAGMAAAQTADAKVKKSFFGISATLPTDGDFTKMGKAGFGSYRFELNWAGVQRTRKGAFDWNGPDAAVRQAATAGMHPVPLLLGTPRFIKKNADGPYAPKDKEDLQAWERFVAAAAARYGPGGEFWAANPGVPENPIQKWLVWNEENAAAFWKPKPNPRAYAKLVKATNRGISGVQPRADIYLGGMYGYPSNDKSPTLVNFLRGFYKVKNVEKAFEGITVHPYGGGVSTVKKQIKEARKAARKGGDPNARILVGEIGWASKGPSKAIEVLGSKGQANALKKGLKILVKKRRAWDIEGAYVYVWRDFPPEFTACLWCPWAGLLKENGKKKPAYQAVRSIIKSS